MKEGLVIMTIVKELAEKNGIKLVYKQDSWLMWLVHNLIVRWFNPKFMTSYHTTIGKTLYHCNKDFGYRDNDRITLLHELCHVKQSQEYGQILFSFLYLFPQILSVFSILVFWNEWFILFGLFALPLPAYFRTMFEIEAYKVTVEEISKLNYDYAKGYISRLKKNFVGPDYYFMAIRYDEIEKELLDHAAKTALKNMGEKYGS